MTINDLQTELKDLIAQDKIEQYFELCSKILNKRTENGIFNSLITIQGQFYDLKTQRKDQIITNEEANTRKNRIRQSLVSLIEDIKLTDLENPDLSLNDLKSIEAQITVNNPAILVICPSEDELEEVSDLFARLNFTKAEVRHLNKFVPVSQYDLVVFDNRDLPYCPQALTEANEETLRKLKISLDQKALIEQRVDLMNKYIDKGYRPMVHWGEILYWINSQRERVHAANSKFSLYARIREVLDFMAAYRV